MAGRLSWGSNFAHLLYFLTLPEAFPVDYFWEYSAFTYSYSGQQPQPRKAENLHLPQKINDTLQFCSPKTPEISTIMVNLAYGAFEDLTCRNLSLSVEHQAYGYEFHQLSSCWCTLVLSALRLKIQLCPHLRKADTRKREVVHTLPIEVLNKQCARKEARALKVKRIRTLEHARTRDVTMFRTKDVLSMCFRYLIHSNNLFQGKIM